MPQRTPKASRADSPKQRTFLLSCASESHTIWFLGWIWPSVWVEQSFAMWIWYSLSWTSQRSWGCMGSKAAVHICMNTPVRFDRLGNPATKPIHGRLSRLQLPGSLYCLPLRPRPQMRLPWEAAAPAAAVPKNTVFLSVAQHILKAHPSLSLPPYLSPFVLGVRKASQPIS